MSVPDQVSVRLEPQASSVGEARRVATATLAGWGRSELVDDAILVVSELVTNAVLHAGTEALLVLRRLEASLRIEVVDGAAVGPAPKDYGTHACTGRGLGVVSMLATGWGVETVAGGKRIWAELTGEVRQISADIDLSAWDDLEPGEPEIAAGPEALVEVHLIGLPVGLQRQSARHYDELVREFQLMRTRIPDHHVPSRLIELTDALTAQFGSFTAGTEAELAAAQRRGEDTVDLVYRVPPEISEAVATLSGMLEEADAYCRAGTELLTLATPPDVVAFRRWFLDEFARQAAGRSPCPWPNPVSLHKPVEPD